MLSHSSLAIVGLSLRGLHRSLLEKNKNKSNDNFIVNIIEMQYAMQRLTSKEVWIFGDPHPAQPQIAASLGSRAIANLAQTRRWWMDSDLTSI